MENVVPYEQLGRGSLVEGIKFDALPVWCSLGIFQTPSFPLSLVVGINLMSRPLPGAPSQLPVVDINLMFPSLPRPEPCCPPSFFSAPFPCLGFSLANPGRVSSTLCRGARRGAFRRRHMSVYIRPHTPYSAPLSIPIGQKGESRRAPPLYIPAIDGSEFGAVVVRDRVYIFAFYSTPSFEIFLL